MQPYVHANIMESAVNYSLKIKIHYKKWKKLEAIT